MVHPIHDDPWELFTPGYDHGSGRAVALTLPALVDNVLGDVLKAHFRKDSSLVKRMLKPSGMLGSYGAKVRIAYMMGIIGKADFSDLEIIGEIRNRFAHTIDCRDFTDAITIANIKKLNIFKEMKEIIETRVFYATNGEEAIIKFSTALITAFQGTENYEMYYRDCIRLMLIHLASVGKSTVSFQV